jgi:hypothetical protein
VTTVASVGSSLRSSTAVRVGVALGALVVASAVVQAALAATIPAPWVFPDELVYWDMARDLAAGHAPAVRGLDAAGRGLVYPLVLTPAAWLFDDPERSYLAAKVLNAVVISLAALPAYGLARRFVSSRGALLVAGLSVLLPSLAYSGLVITENIFYPVVLVALLAMARALERPTVARELTVVLAIAVAVATRPKAVALLGAYVLAVVAYAALESRAGAKPGPGLVARLRRYRVSLALVAAGVAGVVAAPVLLLGVYRSTAADPDFGLLPSQAFVNVAVLDLFVGVVPFCAFLLLARRALSRRGGSRELRELVALTACTSLTFLLLVSAFEEASVLEGHRVLNERNLFFLAPLFLVAFVAWLERREPLTGIDRRLVLAGCVLPVVLGLVHLSYGAGFQTLSLVPWLLFGGAPYSAIPLLLLAALAVRVMRRSPDDRVRAATLFVAGSFVLVSLVVRPVMHIAADRARDHAFSGSPGWIDDAVGGDSSVAVLWRERGTTADSEVRPRIDHRLVWVNEFFNRSVDRVYALGAPMAYSTTLVETPVTLDREGTVRESDGRAVVPRFVLAPCQLAVAGSVLAFDTRTGARLYRADEPLRILALDGGCRRRS